MTIVFTCRCAHVSSIKCPAANLKSTRFVIWLGILIVLYDCLYVRVCREHVRLGILIVLYDCLFGLVCREHVRRRYEELGPGSQEVPSDLPRPLRVGQEVTARHPRSRQLHDGVILTVQGSKYRCA